jgi:hypothetical protein
VELLARLLAQPRAELLWEFHAQLGHLPLPSLDVNLYNLLSIKPAYLKNSQPQQDRKFANMSSSPHRFVPFAGPSTTIGNGVKRSSR